MAAYTIGKLAEKAGVNVETIRYYQRQGLIAEPPRPSSGYRRYSQDAVEELRFIMRAKTLGFSLAEIRELLALDSNDVDARRKLAGDKLELIRNRIRDLEVMAHSLQNIVDSCRSPADSCGCPLRISRTWE
jgi:MerR family mercuric resistance operon transcriptional regulator